MESEQQVPSDEAQERNLGFERAYRDQSFAADYARKHERSAIHKQRDAREHQMWRQLLAPAAPYQSILDCPCGTGRFWPTLIELGGSLAAADASGEMLSAAIARHPEVILQHSEVGMAEALPFADESFDLVFSSRLLHHFPKAQDRRAVLMGLKRVSSKWVAFSTWRRGNWMSLRELRLSKRDDARTRFFLPMAEIVADVEACGMKVAGIVHKQRLLSPLVALLCRKL